MVIVVVIGPCAPTVTVPPEERTVKVIVRARRGPVLAVVPVGAVIAAVPHATATVRRGRALPRAAAVENAPFVGWRGQIVVGLEEPQKKGFRVEKSFLVELVSFLWFWVVSARVWTSLIVCMNHFEILRR